MQTKSTDQNPKENSPVQGEQAFAATNIKATNWAMKIWLLIIVVVLCLLWLETRNSSGKDYNLLLNGDSNTIGAQVFVDGKPSGRMARSAGSDLGGGVFWIRVPDGRHVVDVQKKGFKLFRNWITVRGQAYLGVELLPKQDLPQPGINSGEKDTVESDLLPD